MLGRRSGDGLPTYDEAMRLLDEKQVHYEHQFESWPLQRQANRRALAAVLVAAVGVGLLGLELSTRLFSDILPTAARASARPAFRFDGIDTLVTFGDSFTSTYDWSSRSPFNATFWDVHPKQTFSAGHNWNEVLSLSNAGSPQRLYNYASTSACLERTGKTTQRCSGISANEQVQTFRRDMGDAASGAWSSERTLFALWIGVNDVLQIAAAHHEEHRLIDAKVATLFDKILPQLRAFGALHVVLMTLPPVNRRAGSQPSVDLVEHWNDSLRRAVRRRSNADIILFDAFETLKRALDRPQAVGLRALAGSDAPGYYADRHSDYCYAQLAPVPIRDPQTFVSPSCAAPLWQYFWRDPLHLAPHPHTILADELRQALLKHQ